MCSQYPIQNENILAAYKELSNYILDNERIERNKHFLSGGNRKKMLEQLFCEEGQLVTPEIVRQFMRQDASAVLKYKCKEEINEISAKSTSYYFRKHKNFFVRTVKYIFFNDDKKCLDLLQEKTLTPEQLGLKLILMLTADLNKIQNWWEDTTEIKSIAQIVQKLTHKAEPEDVILLSFQDKASTGNTEPRTEYTTMDELQFIIDITGNRSEEEIYQLASNIKELISFFNKEVRGIQFSFTVDEQIWENYSDIFLELKSNTVETHIKQIDIERFVIKNIKKNTFLSFVSQVKGMGNRILPEDSADALTNIEQEDEAEILDLILGIQKNTKLYSQSVIAYLYEFLQKNPHIKYTELLGVLKRAAVRELETEDKAFLDRLLSFSYIQDELKNIRQD